MLVQPMTEADWIKLRDAAAECRCDFDCYCSSNYERAEEKIEEIRRKRVKQSLPSPQR